MDSRNEGDEIFKEKSLLTEEETNALKYIDEFSDSRMDFNSVRLRLNSAVIDKEFAIIQKLGEFSQNAQPLRVKVDEADAKLAEYETQVDNFLKFFTALRRESKKMEKQNLYIQTRTQNQAALESVVGEIVNEAILSEEEVKVFNNPSFTQDDEQCELIASTLNRMQRFLARDKNRLSACHAIQERTAEYTKMKDKFLNKHAKFLQSGLKRIAQESQEPGLSIPNLNDVRSVLVFQKDIVSALIVMHQPTNPNYTGELMESYAKALSGVIAMKLGPFEKEFKREFLDIPTTKMKLSLSAQLTKEELDTLNRMQSSKLMDWFIEQITGAFTMYRVEELFWQKFFSTKDCQIERKEVFGFMTTIYYELSKTLDSVFEFCGKLSPTTILVFLYSTKIVRNSLKSKFNDFGVSTNYYSKALGDMETKLASLKQKHIAEQLVWLDSYSCSTKYQGLLLPVRNFAHIVQFFYKSVSAGEAEVLVEDTKTLFRNLISWLVNIAGAKPKYRDMTILENALHISRSLNVYKEAAMRSMSMEAFEFFKKHSDRYVAGLFEYNFKKFAEYWRKIQDLQRKLKYENISEILEFRKASFDKHIRAVFGKIDAEVRKINKRMTKHFKDMEIRGLMRNKLKEFMVSEVQKIADFYFKAYGDPLRDVGPEEVKAAFGSEE